MNHASVCAVLSEDPREVSTGVTSSCIRCVVTLPAVGNKSVTSIEYNSYGKVSEQFRQLRKGARVYIHGAKLRYDLDTRTYALHGGVYSEVTEAFRIFNTVILAGRCVKDINHEDGRSFRTTANGFIICNQTLSVNTGRNQADLFNFYAINSAEDKFNQAELLSNFTRKGTGLTIEGCLVTDSWVDQNTKERRTQTKIQLTSMTLAPKQTETAPVVKPQTTVASGENVASLWGGRTADQDADVWGQAAGNGLPDLPGQYGSAPSLEEAPF